MRVDIKFCGMTREEDVALAVSLGAAYVGVVFAAGARQVSSMRAAGVLAAASGAAARVGVFVEQTDDEIARAAHDASLDIVQLHGGVTAGRVQALRRRLALPVWAAVRVRDATSLAAIAALDGVADGVLLDSFAEGRSGGTGTPFDWQLAAGAPRPRHALFIAAGGLNPDTVAMAVRVLSPGVVDVSSGVERAPGIKDHDRMRAFAAAVRHSTGEP
ncbi:MAG TPA: phosphoribosylanthranilate isomerase [Gemmatimonadaceae bacterium]|nr:phosphoribosylanthranilate isomerase [Gemmatimonadaceae bacterium]